LYSFWLKLNRGSLAQATEVVGDVVDVREWEEAVTTEVGGLTAGADGSETKSASTASPAAAAPEPAISSGTVAGGEVAVVYVLLLLSF
jgi:hypothetical protein